MLKTNNYTHKNYGDPLGWFIPSYSKMESKVVSIFDNIIHKLSLCNKRCSNSHIPLVTANNVSNAKNTNNQGLIVYIHGLNSDQKVGELLYLKEIEKKSPGKYEIWVPKIPEKGNCSLEDAADPLLKAVRKYIQTNPGKPVQLVGHSNGGRIAAYIETNTRDLDVNMRVTGIAGVFLGTDMVSIGKFLGIMRFFMPSSLSREMATKSKTAKNLINSMKEDIVKGSREYTFYATQDDIAIPNYTSCFPKIGKNEKCVLKKGCSHNSIQSRVLKEEVSRILSFMSKN